MLSDQDIAFYKRFVAKFKCAEHRIKLRNCLPSIAYYGFGSESRNGKTMRTVLPSRVSFQPQQEAIHPFAILLEGREFCGDIITNIAILFKSNSHPVRIVNDALLAFERGTNRSNNEYFAETLNGQMYYLGCWIKQYLSHTYWGAIRNRDQEYNLKNWIDKRLFDYLTP